MGHRGPTQLEEGKGTHEEGKSMIKGMSVVENVVLFLGSGDPILLFLDMDWLFPSPKMAFPFFCMCLNSMQP